MKRTKNIPIAITSGTGKNLPNHSGLYIKAAEEAGLFADFISPGMEIHYLLENYNGFIIPGGKDLNPSYYKEKKIFRINPEEEKRIEFEFFLLHEIIKKRKPVLGICYGMQIMNVCFKGTLYQDIRSQIEGALNHEQEKHVICVHDNPYLEPGEYEVNSSHHQAVRDIGTGLEPFAYASDGIIEAYYHKTQPFIMGVQWHLERMNDITSKRIFDAFGKACYADK